MGIAAVLTIVMGVSAGAAAQTQIERGIKVYAEQKCSVCHSIDGKGNVKGPLDSVGLRLSADEAYMLSLKKK